VGGVKDDAWNEVGRVRELVVEKHNQTPMV